MVALSVLLATSSSPTSRSLFVHLRSNRRLFTKRLTTVPLAKSRWIFILALMKSGRGDIMIYSLAVSKFQPSSAVLVISDYKNWHSNSLKSRLLVLF